MRPILNIMAFGKSTILMYATIKLLPIYCFLPCCPSRAQYLSLSLVFILCIPHCWQILLLLSLSILLLLLLLLNLQCKMFFCSYTAESPATFGVNFVVFFYRCSMSSLLFHLTILHFHFMCMCVFASLLSLPSYFI